MLSLPPIIRGRTCTLSCDCHGAEVPDGPSWSRQNAAVLYAICPRGV